MGQPTFQEAWAALDHIREAIEEFAPVGTLISSEQVLAQKGPEFIHEVEALVEGIAKWGMG